MINMLTRAIGRPWLLRPWPLLWPAPWRPLNAKLTGVNGFTGRGVFLLQHDADDPKLIIALSGVAGREAEIVVNDDWTKTIDLVNGRASATFTSKRGDILPELGDGARINIRQNGDIILSGVLSRN